MKGFHESKTNPERRDETETPWEVFLQIERLMGIEFTWDVCATEENSKCPYYYGPDNGEEESKFKNGLKADWSINLELGAGHIYHWMNPPYSDCASWCKKAYNEAKKGLVVVGLLPDDRSTKWYQNWIENKATLCYVPDRRISFLEPETKKEMKGNNRGSVFPVWTPWGSNYTQYVRFKLC